MTMPVSSMVLTVTRDKRFRHNDMEDLERVLDEIPDDHGKLVVVDGLFSMGGDIAPLPDITRICKQYNSRLMVDDAHAIGVLGNGKGTAAHFGIVADVDLIMGTFKQSLSLGDLSRVMRMSYII
jgi:7-keto-8-aminopelargonate synthetase-like enzyme